MDLAGKVVAITGAGSGIGRALALALVERHAAVALADRDADGMAETYRLATRNGVASQHLVDVADAAAVERFADDVVATHGGVHVAVNNAGAGIFGTVEQLSLDEIRWLMDVNFWGVVYGCKAFLPLLRAQPAACIVNISSVFGLWGPPGQSAYAASKFAVRGFSESLRGELQGSGIHVVTVHPGGIKTAIAKHSRVAAAADPRAAARMTETFDRRFLTTPPEVPARAIVDAIVHGKDRVLTGRDARRVDLMTRLFPERAPRWFNRVSQPKG